MAVLSCAGLLKAPAAGDLGAVLHGQAVLPPIKRLDLALLVDTQDPRLVRRIEVEPDDILDLGGERHVRHLRDLLRAQRFDPRGDGWCP